MGQLPGVKGSSGASGAAGVPRWTVRDVQRDEERDVAGWRGGPAGWSLHRCRHPRSMPKSKTRDATENPESVVRGRIPVF